MDRELGLTVDIRGDGPEFGQTIQQLRVTP